MFTLIPHPLFSSDTRYYSFVGTQKKEQTHTHQNRIQTPGNTQQQQQQRDKLNTTHTHTHKNIFLLQADKQ